MSKKTYDKENQRISILFNKKLTIDEDLYMGYEYCYK